MSKLHGSQACCATPPKRIKHVARWWTRCFQASANKLGREGGWVLAFMTGGCDLPDIPAISS